MESDQKCVLAQMDREKSKNHTHNNCTPESKETNFHQRLSKYTQEREARIAKFLATLNERRKAFFESLLPQRTWCQFEDLEISWF